MKRRIISLSGGNSQVAVADDGSVWIWDNVKWSLMQRPDLPESEGLDFYANSGPLPDLEPIAEQIARGADVSLKVPEYTGAVSNTAPIPPKRGPGRPKKVQP